MIFNFWKQYPKRKPKKTGVYLCTISYGDNPEESYIAKLFYDKYFDKWFNEDRMTVFKGYKVYKQCREPIEDNRVYEDSLCEVSHLVIAFRRLPKVYVKRKLQTRLRQS